MQEVNSRCKEYHLPSNLTDMTGQSASRVAEHRKHVVANGSVLKATVQRSWLHSNIRIGCADFVANESTLVTVPVEHLEHVIESDMI